MIGRINPLYILGGVSVLLLISILSLYSIKSNYTDAKIKYKETKELTTKLVSLKRLYSKRFILPRKYNSSVEVTHSGATTKLYAQKINLQELNSLMKYIINSTYQIQSFKIEKISKTKATLKMDIK